MSEKTRSSFEADLRAKCIADGWGEESIPLALRRDVAGNYSALWVQCRWEGWRSCRRQALEEAAAIVEALRDDHCRGTGHPLADKNACAPDGADGCEFVAAWNDAASAIRREAEAK